MENNQLLLSICIPTNGIVDWVIPVIDSIYSQGVNNTLFEVVVADNGGKKDLQEAVRRYNYPNFHYFKTDSQGFTNQIDAFEKCKGVFCKMLNHRSKMMPGSIEALLNLIKKYQDTKPILYCSEGHISGGDIIECANTDEFVKNLGVYVSWSAGTGAWREDLNNLRNLEVNKLFPHTALLFNIRTESMYVIWNVKYEIMANDAGKGGYDIFYAFSVVLPDIINNLRISGKITDAAFISFKKDLFNYIKSIYYDEIVCPTKRTFLIQNIKGSMMVYYGNYYYYKMIVLSYLRRPLAIVKHFLLKLIGK